MVVVPVHHVVAQADAGSSADSGLWLGVGSAEPPCSAPGLSADTRIGETVETIRDRILRAWSKALRLFVDLPPQTLRQLNLRAFNPVTTLAQPLVIVDPSELSCQNSFIQYAKLLHTTLTGEWAHYATWIAFLRWGPMPPYQQSWAGRLLELRILANERAGQDWGL